jgi:hypothetical protein
MVNDHPSGVQNFYNGNPQSKKTEFEINID